MNIANWLQSKDINTFPLLELDGFKTFIKLCEIVSNNALDDSGLANRSNSYKIWVCWIKDNTKFINEIDKYKSMNLLKHYLEVSVIETGTLGLYIKLDYIENKWKMSYGLTDNKKLYKIGEFDYTINLKIEANSIMKYINEEIGEFDPRNHYILRLVKHSIITFNPGYCQRQDAYINNNQVILTCQGLGNWINNTLANDEANRLLGILRIWVSKQEWWNLVKIQCIVKKNGYIDFIIEPK